MSAVHSVAVSGFGEGYKRAGLRLTQQYDRARPSYPEATLQRVLRAATEAHSGTSSGSKGLTIIEPGSGTGIFTRLMLAPPEGYPSWDIAHLVAVEPSSGMRAQWQKGVDAVRPKELSAADIRTVEGGFDDLSNSGLEPGSVDLVVIAQAYHWCPDHNAALREFAKYLSPTGVLVFVWNLERQGTPWYDFIKPVYAAHDLGTPQYYKGLWKEGYDTEAYKELFEPPVHEQDTWSLGMTEQTVKDRTLSKSFLTEQCLSGQAREDFIAKLEQTIRDAPKTWIDKEKGIFEYDYQTDVFIMRKKHK